ncbi:MAG: nitroreductase family deazaflavin-dependent oxidoreductase [Candidatus Bathyarchaeia archaeon]
MENDQKLSKLGAEKFIYLTTTGRKTRKPHRVELWFAAVDDNIYLSHEGRETDWMRNIKNNPEVNFEISGNKFVGKARYLQSDESEAVKAKIALYLKYYGKAEERIIEDWFSLSTLILIERKA